MSAFFVRHKWLAVFLLLEASIGLGGCDGFGPPPPGELPIIFYEEFENGLSLWKKGSDLPDDPNRPDQKMEWHIETSARAVQSGSYSAEFYLDGRQDDGTIWLARRFSVPAGKAVSVHLYFYLWSESESSANRLADVVAYAGAQPPTVEADFPDRQAANQKKGWVKYHYQITVPQHDGTLWVAFGISATWETQLTYYIDSVKIEIE